MPEQTRYLEATLKRPPMNRGQSSGASTENDIVAHSFNLGQRLLDTRSAQEKKQAGQFLTTPAVARYMVRKLGALRQDCRVLEPAIGSGTLICALIEYVVKAGYPKALTIEGYEIDADLAAAARDALAVAVDYARANDIHIQACIRQTDFVLARTTMLQPSLFPVSGQNDSPEGSYDVVLANPPYFKLNAQDPRAKAATGLVSGHTNIYTLFMALSIQSLASQGQACFIVPRSFCSGAYFAKFRREFIKQVAPTHVHLFESRQEAFKAEDVLQENIIIAFRKQSGGESLPFVTISTSTGTDRLHYRLSSRQVSPQQFLGKHNGSIFFRLPITELDQTILDVVDRWPGSLAQYGCQVSTGPVVPFRAEDLLQETDEVKQGEAVPLLWMHHISCQRVTWPVSHGNKPQAIARSAAATGLLLPVANYVLTRRFSAKEERRRLVAAPFLREEYEYNLLGLENHLNYIYRPGSELCKEEASGLSALLNSALVDRYFRISNGNTQVNATELRALPLPTLNVIRQIGHQVLASQVETIDHLVFSTLRETGYLPPDFPTIEETRFTMGKIQEAQDILKTLGLPRPQQNEISALTLLVLAQISEDTPWAQATSASLRIHDILQEIQARYGRQYAENTRETIRRQVIHQFVQAGLLLRNPDDLLLPTNSPRTHYALAEPVVETIRTYDSADWPVTAQAFLENQRALIETYQRQREQHKVPLVMEDGLEYHLSPGSHNELQVAIIEEFGPRFAPGARVLYVGDTANKTLHIDMSTFEQIGISITRHDKLPDVVLYDEAKDWIYLIEAVTSHGPVSPKRQVELQEMLTGTSAGVVYVTAFPDFNTFKNFLFDIAWDTEVWIANRPDHLIHFNGDRFMGPRSS